MAIKKIKLPNNSTVDINDARDVPIIDSEGYIDSEVSCTIRGFTSATGLLISLPGSADGNEDLTLESTSNKVISLSSSSTDTQYPSAKCVYDLLGDVESLILAL